MKLAVTVKGSELTDAVDPRFGRAPYILVVDTETMEYEALDNSENVNAFKGAGIKAATTVADRGAEVLLTGYCGPNAFKTLKVAGTKVVNDVSGSAQDAIKSFLAGAYEFSDEANVDGHW